MAARGEGPAHAVPTQAELLRDTEELIRRQRQRGADYKFREGPGAWLAPARRPRAQRMWPPLLTRAPVPPPPRPRRRPPDAGARR